MTMGLRTTSFTQRRNSPEAARFESEDIALLYREQAAVSRDSFANANTTAWSPMLRNELVQGLVLCHCCLEIQIISYYLCM